MIDELRKGVSRLLRRSWAMIGAGAVVAFSLQHAASAAHYATVVHPNLPQVAANLSTPLEPLQVDRSWIIEGNPVFRARTYFESDDGFQAGVFECEGPGKFVWHYDLDETIYILDGSVNIEYGGATHTLHPGDSAYFRAGMSALWNVKGHLRKSFVVREPGRINRWLRRLL